MAGHPIPEAFHLDTGQRAFLRLSDVFSAALDNDLGPLYRLTREQAHDFMCSLTSAGADWEVRAGQIRWRGLTFIVDKENK